MPRPALKNVSTAALQAELQKRLARLPKLLALKAQVEADLADLQALAGQFGQTVAAPATVAVEPKPVAKRGRPRKVKPVKVAAKPMAKKAAAAKPAQVTQTATEFILGLLKGKTLTTRQVNEAWKNAGRAAVVNVQLSRLVKLGKVKRAAAPTGAGSVYSVAGGKASVGAVAKSVTKKPAAKPVAKKPGKKTFTCPTCKAVFASGPMLGVHYKAEPTHRQK